MRLETMLSQRSLSSVESLAISLAVKQRTVVPIPESPLAVLISSSTPISENYEDIDAEIIKASNIKGLNNICKHDIDMDEYTSMVVNAVSYTVDTARNTVNPKIEEFNSTIDSYTSRPVETIHVIQKIDHKLFKNSGLDELTKKYAGVETRTSEWDEETWPPMDADILRKCIASPINRIASDLKALMDDVDDELLIEIYNYIFRYGTVDKTATDIDSIIAVIGFMLSSYWLTNIPDDVNMEKGKLELELAIVKSKCGKSIQKEIESIEYNSRTNQFVISKPAAINDNRPIVVRASGYTKWIESGGSPELLIGAVLSGTIPGPSISEIEHANWITAYKRRVRLGKLSEDAQRTALVTMAVKTYINNEIRELPESERSSSKMRLSSAVDSKPYRITISVEHWFREILCKSLYPHSSVLKVLEYIDEAMLDDPDIQPREAATLATINMVTDWLAENLTVS